MMAMHAPTHDAARPMEDVDRHHFICSSRRATKPLAQPTTSSSCSQAHRVSLLHRCMRHAAQVAFEDAANIMSSAHHRNYYDTGRAFMIFAMHHYCSRPGAEKRNIAAGLPGFCCCRLRCHFLLCGRTMMPRVRIARRRDHARRR